MDLVPILVTVGSALSVIGTVMFRKKGTRTDATLDGGSQVPLSDRIDAFTQIDIRRKREKLKLSKQRYQDALDLTKEIVNEANPHADEQERAKLIEEWFPYFLEEPKGTKTRKKQNL